MILNSHDREGKNPRQLRAEGKITAEFYGPDIKNQSLTLDYNEFEKVYNESGEASLVDLKTPDGKIHHILIGEVQKHPVLGRFTNVDLRQVSMTEKIEAEAELKFIGEAPAVKKLGGIFAPGKSTLMIKALPKDLINEIEVDISVLKTFEDKINVSDIKLPEGVEAAEEAEVAIASVSEPRAEEGSAPSAEDEATAVADVAVEGEKKEDDKEGEKKEEN